MMGEKVEARGGGGGREEQQKVVVGLKRSALIRDREGVSGQTDRGHGNLLSTHLLLHIWATLAPSDRSIL